MGWAYSVDLRERVVAAFDRTGMTDQEAAALFKIGEATVRRWKRLKRETGALERRPGGGGNPPRIKPTSAGGGLRSASRAEWTTRQLQQEGCSTTCDRVGNLCRYGRENIEPRSRPKKNEIGSGAGDSQA
jgi:transposase